MEKHTLFMAVDTENNAAIGWGTEEVTQAIQEYECPPIRLMAITVDVATPQPGDSEDHVSTITMEAPPQPVEGGDGDDDGDGEEAPTEAPEEGEPEAPPELPAEAPAQPEPATVAA
jgi:hypothetical protein